MDNQLERERSVDGKIQIKKCYADILKTDRNTGRVLKRNRDERGDDVQANKSCLRVDFRVNETHVTNNRVQRGRLKIAKSKIIDSCDLDKVCINNVSLASEIVHGYKRGNFKSVTSPPEFMTDSVYLMNLSEVQKTKLSLFTQDK